MTIDVRVLGQRIADARLRAGLTQAQLAAEVSLDRSALAKIEIGDRRVTALELSRISAAVDERLEWFFQEVPQAIASHRNLLDPGGASPAIDRAVERRVREVEFVASAGSGLDLPVLESREMPANAEAAEELAAEARALLDVPADGPLHMLERYVSKAGILPFVVDLGPDSADAASILLERGAVVVVNGSLKVGRRRLSLAHELGHVLVADEYSVDWRVASEDSVARREGRIDRFARALLLPAKDLHARWPREAEGSDGELRTAAVRLGSEYRVDMATLARRLQELDLVGPSDAAAVRAVRTVRADIEELNLVVADELPVDHMAREYIAAVLRLYRSELISQARTLELLFGAWTVADLPILPMRSAEEIWQYV
ncbi:XRE family transcriptional regulator [Myceligenerans crystallogenes]|uniref:HTH cro/C1-type domain-containing protein n=1 Tax=Myceligenerans crystallogenes TaxID=316335 RepID=A0ABP4ZT57_9MICO